MISGSALSPKTIAGESVDRFFLSHVLLGLGMEAGSSYTDEDEKYFKIPKIRAEAARKALVGFEYQSQQEKEGEARGALQMDPDCCEAYNLLGFSQPSLETALPHFLKAVELGPKISPKFDEAVKSKALWDRVPFRAYFRAHLYVANTYRKMGRYREALDHYLILVGLDNNFYPMRSSCKWPRFRADVISLAGSSITFFLFFFSSFLLFFSQDINFRYHIPEMYLRLKDYAGMKKFLFETSSNVLSECLTYSSTCVPWAMNIALMDFVTMKTSTSPSHITSPLFFFSIILTTTSNKNNIIGKYPTYFDSSLVQISKNGSSVLSASEVCYKAIDYLLGKRTLPRIKTPATYGKVTSELQSILYASTTMDLWKSTPGALEWLRTCHNTRWAQVHLGDFDLDPPRPGLDKFSFFQTLLDEGIYDDAPLDRGGRCLIHVVVLGPKSSAEHLKAYLQKYRVKTSYSLTPLNMAFYYDADPAIIGMLMDKGDLAYFPNRAVHESPIAMAANQGNWRGIKYVFENRPEVFPSQDAKESAASLLAETLCSSSVPFCLLGGEKCTRCIQDHRRHPPTCDFNKGVDVLIANGLSSDFRPSMPDHPVSKYLLAKLKEKKKQPQPQPQPQPRPQSQSQPQPQIKDAKAASAAVSKAEPAGKQKKEKVCSTCGEQKEKLMICGGCKGAWYCNRECQRRDWPTHKPTCVSPAKGTQ